MLASRAGHDPEGVVADADRPYRARLQGLGEAMGTGWTSRPRGLGGGPVLSGDATQRARGARLVPPRRTGDDPRHPARAPGAPRSDGAQRKGAGTAPLDGSGGPSAL